MLRSFYDSQAGVRLSWRTFWVSTARPRACCSALRRERRMEVLNPRLSLELSGLLSGSLLPEPQLLLCASPAGARVPDYVCWARKRVRRPKVTLRPKGLQLTSVSDWAKLCSLVRLRSVLIFPSFNVTFVALVACGLLTNIGRLMSLKM